MLQDVSNSSAPRDDVSVAEIGSWTGQPVSVDPRQILRVHRYPDPDAVRPVIQDAARRIAEQVVAIAAPVAVYRQVRIESCTAEALRLQGGTEFRCDAFERFLGDCSHVIVFVLTLGPKLDERVVALMDEFEPLDALFVESAGWLSIELATRQFASHLRQKLRAEGRALAHRMGPGYSYRKERGGAERVEWPLREQTDLFKLLEGEALPVELLSSCAMIPKMSRSGMFGVRTVGEG